MSVAASQTGGESPTALAREPGYSDRSGMHRVVTPLEEQARSDQRRQNGLEAMKKRQCQMSGVDPMYWRRQAPRPPR